MSGTPKSPLPARRGAKLAHVGAYPQAPKLAARQAALARHHPSVPGPHQERHQSLGSGVTGLRHRACRISAEARRSFVLFKLILHPQGFPQPLPCSATSQTDKRHKEKKKIYRPSGPILSLELGGRRGRSISFSPA